MNKYHIKIMILILNGVIIIFNALINAAYYFLEKFFKKINFYRKIIVLRNKLKFKF